MAVIRDKIANPGGLNPGSIAQFGKRLHHQTKTTWST